MLKPFTESGRCSSVHPLMKVEEIVTKSKANPPLIVINLQNSSPHVKYIAVSALSPACTIYETQQKQTT